LAVVRVASIRAGALHGGPIWQVSLIHVKPNQMDTYLSSLQEKAKPIYEEAKRQGTILDYKVFLNTTQHDPQDWDIAIGVQFKNFAAMDGLTAKMEALRDKVLGSKQTAHELGEKRQEMREIVSVMLLREVTLK
jgi:hypothetical protein